MPSEAMPATGVRRGGPKDPLIVRWTLILLAIAVMSVRVIIRVVNVFYQACGAGRGTYGKTLTADADTRHSIWLTLTVVPVSVALNVVFGVAAAWAITRFHF